MRATAYLLVVTLFSVSLIADANADAPAAPKTVAAMLAEIATWDSAQRDNITVYAPLDDNSKIVIAVGDAELTSPANIKTMNMILPIAEQYCPGLTSAKPQKTQNMSSQILTTNGNTCALLSGIGTDGRRVFVLSLEKTALLQNRVSYATVLYAQTAGRGPAGTAMANPASIGTPTPGTKSAPAALQSAIDSIPVNRRPIGLVYTEGEWDSYNASVTFVPHLLFPGGIMIDAHCTTWHPMKPVTKFSAMGCAADSYTLKGRTAFYKGDSESIDDYQGFKRGERIAVNFSRVGGLPNTGVPNAGSNAVWGGELTMTAAGQIRVGSWSGSTISGTGFTGYGGGAARSIQGDYFLDGYLMAVRDAQGTISVSFIWQQDGQHIFLNGKQYNR